jgi:hypothetical protein
MRVVDQVSHQCRPRRTDTDGFLLLLSNRVIRDVFPVAIDVLSPQMCPRPCVSELSRIVHFVCSSSMPILIPYSICLVVFSLLAEVPHDVAFYCKLVCALLLAPTG